MPLERGGGVCGSPTGRVSELAAGNSSHEPFVIIRNQSEKPLMVSGKVSVREGGQLVKNGGDLVELSARLGQASPAITASVYSHEFEVARRSEERTAHLDAIYGSTVAAQGRSDAQPAPQGAEVANRPSARRGPAQADPQDARLPPPGLGSSPGRRERRPRSGKLPPCTGPAPAEAFVLSGASRRRRNRVNVY